MVVFINECNPLSKHIWLNTDIPIPFLPDSTWKTKFYVDEIIVFDFENIIYIISSFEGNTL